MTVMAPLVLDPASGSRMMWFDRNDPRVLFGDIRQESHTLCDGRTLEVSPDLLMDFRDLPLASETFQLVVFDPPHLRRAGQNSYMARKYGTLDRETWQADLAQGFKECFRVLKPHGVLIFKWNETQIPLSQILPLALPHRPLFGHRSGKTARTHWMTFMKDAET